MRFRKIAWIEEPNYYAWQEGLFRSLPHDAVDGKATIRSEPGRGVEIGRDWLSADDHRISIWESAA